MFHLVPPVYTYCYISSPYIGFYYPSYFPQLFTANIVDIPENNDIMDDPYNQKQHQQNKQQQSYIDKNEKSPSTPDKIKKGEHNQQHFQHEHHKKHYSDTDNNSHLDIENGYPKNLNDTAVLPNLEYILLPKEQLPAQEQASFEDMERLPKKHLLWTEKEDCLLIKLRDYQKQLSWREISSHFPNRSINSCQFRWKRLKSIKSMTKITENKNIHKTDKKLAKYPKRKNRYSEVFAKNFLKAYIKDPKDNNMKSMHHTSNIKLLLN